MYLHPSSIFGIFIRRLLAACEGGGFRRLSLLYEEVLAFLGTVARGWFSPLAYRLSPGRFSAKPSLAPRVMTACVRLPRFGQLTRWGPSLGLRRIRRKLRTACSPPNRDLFFLSWAVSNASPCEGVESFGPGVRVRGRRTFFPGRSRGSLVGARPFPPPPAQEVPHFLALPQDDRSVAMVLIVLVPESPWVSSSLSGRNCTRGIRKRSNSRRHPTWTQYEIVLLDRNMSLSSSSSVRPSFTPWDDVVARPLPSPLPP